jgi:hypothetical protein
VQAGVQRLEVLLQVLAILLPRHAVDAGGRPALEPPVGRSEPLDRDVV